MKTLIYATLVLVMVPAYGFNWKKFFKEDLKYDAHFGFGQVNMEIENDFNSDFDFTFINVGGGASYTYQNKYRIFAITSIKKYTNLDFTHAGKSGSKSVSAVYNDWYFGVGFKWKGYMLTAGWDNLNYFLGESTKIIKPVRIDRASIKLDYPINKKFTPSAKLGVLLPVFDDVTGIDINLGAKYLITRDRKLYATAYYYYASLKADEDTGSSNAIGLGLGYLF